MAIEVVDYDDAWPVVAEAARPELLAALPGVLTAVEHMGSTGVPGMRARRIIDLMAAAEDLAQVTAQDDTLQLPADAHRSADLKRDLAASHLTSSEYTRAKMDLIQQITDQVRAERGLVPVPVREE